MVELGPVHTLVARDWHPHWVRHAWLAAEMSTCLTRHTGAVIVKGRRLISSGFNGNVPGAVHCVDGGCLRCSSRKFGEDLAQAAGLSPDAPVIVQGERAALADIHTITSGAALDVCVCVHAEANAVAQCARIGTSCHGATVYTTNRPCLDCVKLLAVAGIVEVVYAEDYPATYDVPPTITMWQWVAT